MHRIISSAGKMPTHWIPCNGRQIPYSCYRCADSGRQGLSCCLWIRSRFKCALLVRWLGLVEVNTKHLPAFVICRKSHRRSPSERIRLVQKAGNLSGDSTIVYSASLRKLLTCKPHAIGGEFANSTRIAQRSPSWRSLIGRFLF